jgi:erythromycin esterase
MRCFFHSVAAILVLAAVAIGQPAQTEAANALENGKPVERDLKPGETHAYTLRLETGQFLGAAVNQRGIDVVVYIFAPDGSQIAEIDSPNGTQGDEPIELEVKAGGTYRIDVRSAEKDAEPGRYQIRINEILSPDAYARRLAENKRKQQVVITWLKENGIPLKTVEAVNGFADLEPLKKTFKDVRFVGLGEETHGTREFFQFKHRMLEFLVREMGFRVFAIEASYAACQNINDYVMGISQDGPKALDSQGFWTWNTEEVRAMMDWMRTYNQSVPADKKVKFVGFDIQFNDPGKTKLLEYLKRVAPERVAGTEEFFKVNLDELNSVSGTPEQRKETGTKLRELQIKYQDLYLFLELSGPDLAARSSLAEYEQMREYARVLLQYLESYKHTDLSGVVLRDLYMADNFRRLVSREPAGTRFVIWAHNGHITTSDSDGTYPTFGYHLRRFYGTEYYALGFSFNQGSFQAREAEPKDPAKRMLMSFTTKPAPSGSVDWYLAQTNLKNFIIDFRAPRKTAELNEWLAAVNPMRSIGSGYAPSFETGAFSPTILGKEFDGLFFIETTARARPNPSVKNVAQSQ